MKEYEKLANEYTVSSRYSCLRYDDEDIISSYQAGFLKAREMAIAEVLKEHVLSELVPSGVFIILERLGEKEV